MPDLESWLPVVGSEDWYQVSDLGRVRSVLRQVTLRDGRTCTYQGRYLQPSANPRDGHMQIGLSGHGGARLQTKVHTLVLKAFTGPPPPGKIGRHLDGDPGNNAWLNLAWGTHSENMFDKIRHGRDWRSLRQHCNWGHLLISPNLGKGQTPGHRLCLACMRAHNSVSYGRGKGWERDFRTIAHADYLAIMGFPPAEGFDGTRRPAQGRARVYAGVAS